MVGSSRKRSVRQLADDAILVVCTDMPKPNHTDDSEQAAVLTVIQGDVTFAALSFDSP